MMYREKGETIIPVVRLPKPISCCDEELVEVELEALRQGAEQARQDGSRHLIGMQAIRKAAVVACDRSLEVQYLPLDEQRFREVFTLAWCAGYLSQSPPH